ncbi:MAG: AI-2E family transporter, partial [[Clostridium] leptum]
MKHLDLKKGIILITYGILLTMVIIKWDFFSGMFSNVSGLLAPFIYGLVLAFLVNGLYEFFRQKVFRRLGEKKNGKYIRQVRALSVTVSYLLVFLCVTAMVWIVIPQLVVSISQLGKNIGGYAESAEKAVTDFIAGMGLNAGFQKQIDLFWNQLGTQITNIAGQVAPKLIDFTMDFTTGVINWVIGLVVSVYMLYSKETLIRQVKKLVVAVLPVK